MWLSVQNWWVSGSRSIRQVRICCGSEQSILSSTGVSCSSHTRSKERRLRLCFSPGSHYDAWAIWNDAPYPVVRNYAPLFSPEGRKVLNWNRKDKIQALILKTQNNHHHSNANGLPILPLIEVNFDFYLMHTLNMMVNLQISCLSLPSFVILTVTIQLINFLAMLKGRGTDTLNANHKRRCERFR